MSLLLLTTEFPPGPGGIGTHAYQVALNLVRRSWEVAGLTPHDYASAEEINKFNRVQLYLVFLFRRTRLAGLPIFAILGYGLTIINYYPARILRV
jgi:hypothetical protein